MKGAAVLVLGALMVAASAHAQTPARDAPDFRVQVWGYIVADFSALMGKYADLRTTLEQGLTPLTVTGDPADIDRAEYALAKRIRRARPGAAEGEIFTPVIAAEFRKALTLEIDAETRAAIMDENPGDFSHRINGTYAKEHSLSTVPANVLALLPRLPDDVQYRFLGSHLILHDTRANVILDRLPCAIACSKRASADDH